MSSQKSKLGTFILYPDLSPTPYALTIRRDRITDEYLGRIEELLSAPESSQYAWSEWFPVRFTNDIQKLMVEVTLISMGEPDENFSMVLDMHWDELLLGQGYPVGNDFQEGKEILKDSKLAIWWLDATTIKHLGSYWEGTKEYLGIPSYILSEISSATGRNGRGRLWTSMDRPYIRNVRGVPAWAPEEANLLGYTSLNDCAGIVIYERHVDHLMEHFPGVFTKLDMMPIGKGPDIPKPNYDVIHF